MLSCFTNLASCRPSPEPIFEYYILCDEDNNLSYSPAPVASVLYHDFTPSELIKRGIDPSRITFSTDPVTRISSADNLSNFVSHLPNPIN